MSRRRMAQELLPGREQACCDSRGSHQAMAPPVKCLLTVNIDGCWRSLSVPWQRLASVQFGSKERHRLHAVIS